MEQQEWDWPTRHAGPWSACSSAIAGMQGGRRWESYPVRRDASPGQLPRQQLQLEVGQVRALELGSSRAQSNGQPAGGHATTRHSMLPHLKQHHPKCVAIRGSNCLAAAQDLRCLQGNGGQAVQRSEEADPCRQVFAVHAPAEDCTPQTATQAAISPAVGH